MFSAQCRGGSGAVDPGIQAKVLAMIKRMERAVAAVLNARSAVKRIAEPNCSGHAKVTLDPRRNCAGAHIRGCRA
jgi:hypothetical protein